MVAFFGIFLDFCANIVFWGKMGLFGCFVFKFNKNKENKMKIEKIIFELTKNDEPTTAMLSAHAASSVNN